MVDIIIRKRPRKDGAIVYEYKFEIATIDGVRRWQTKSGFKTKADAQRAGKSALQQYENFGRVINKEEISYADFLDYWLQKDCAVDLKPNTLKGYRTKVDINIKPKLGRYKLKSITREILQDFIMQIFDEGYSYNSIITIKGILTKSLNYAEDNYFINRSPAVRLRTPKNRKPKVKTRSAPHHFIPPNAMEKIFERFPERSSQYLALKLGYECGLRLGEAFGLCWEDVDFDKKLLKINRQIQWMVDTTRNQLEKLEKNGTADGGKGYWYFTEPKYKSYRMIELSDSLIEILLRERERQRKAKEYYEVYYTEYSADEHLTFTGEEPSYPTSINKISCDTKGFPVHFINVREDGSFVSPRSMQHVSKIIKRDIFKDFDFHSLRITHASMLAEMGVDPKYIQTRLGHANMKTTFKVYVQVTDLMRTRGRACINELYR